MKPPEPDDIPVFAAVPVASAVGQGGFAGKLIVAVHGMGDQTRNDFAQTIGRMFARYYASKNKTEYQALLLPLGAWDGGRETSVDDPALAFSPVYGCGELSGFAFAEMHWADIARSMEADGYRLEEATHWARSVVNRLAQRHRDNRRLGPKQFHLAGFVIEEIAETLALLQKIAMSGKLFHLSKKDVDTVLTQYLCDVQQVGDYQRQREKFRDRFFNRIEMLHKKYPEAEIHIIAHSEGTVVSLFSLLAALCSAGRKEVEGLRSENRRESLDPKVSHPREPQWNWVNRLVSFTTMGSPIDKHLHLWPEMWRLFEKNAGWVPDVPKIRWRNYYDYADPVGYELDSAKLKLAKWGCTEFPFGGIHDHGYRRYPLPGKAHLDYFKDDGLFAHVIEDAVCGKGEGRAPVPANNWRGICSPLVPFLVVSLILYGAVFILGRGAIATQGFLKDAALEPWKCFSEARSFLLLGPWALLAGTTMMARILRLTRDIGMILLSFVAFFAGAMTFWFCPESFGLEAGYRAGGFLFAGEEFCGTLMNTSKIVVIFWALLAVAAAWLADYIACLHRWRPVWALRVFILLGTAFLAFTIFIPRIRAQQDSAFALLSSLAGFSVAWWLGTLLFDLAFCWQRYINTEKSWLDRVCK